MSLYLIHSHVIASYFYEWLESSAHDECNMVVMADV